MRRHLIRTGIGVLFGMGLFALIVALIVGGPNTTAINAVETLSVLLAFGFLKASGKRLKGF